MRSRDCYKVKMLMLVVVVVAVVVVVWCFSRKGSCLTSHSLATLALPIVELSGGLVWSGPGFGFGVGSGSGTVQHSTVQYSRPLDSGQHRM